MFTQKFPQLFLFYGSCRSASPVSSTVSALASLQATSWPLIGSSGGSNSIDCQSTEVDCSQCFCRLNHTSTASERKEEECVSCCSFFFIFIKSTEDHVFHSLSQQSLAVWYKSAVHTALINGRGGQLSVPAPSHILLASP